MSNTITERKHRNKYKGKVFPERFALLLESRAADGITYSMATVGEKLGITRQAIGSWKNGVTAPTVPALISFAKLYDVSVDWLLGLSDIRSTDENVKTAAAVIGVKDDDTVHAISRIFAALSYSDSHQDMPDTQSDIDYQIFVEAIIQSDYFYRMIVDGYVEFIDNGIDAQMKAPDFKPIELTPDNFGSTAYEAHALITHNAYWAAVSTIENIIRYANEQPTLANLLKWKAASTNPGGITK